MVKGKDGIGGKISTYSSDNGSFKGSAISLEILISNSGRHWTIACALISSTKSSVGRQT